MNPLAFWINSLPLDQVYKEIAKAQAENASSKPASSRLS